MSVRDREGGDFGPATLGQTRAGQRESRSEW